MEARTVKVAPKISFAVTNDVSTMFFSGFLKYLRSQGWDVSFIASDSGRLERFGAEEAIRVVPVSMEREPAPLKDIVSLVRMIIVIRKIRPTIFVYSTPKAALLGALAAWVNRVPRRYYFILGLRHETTTGVKRALLLVAERIAAVCSTQVLAVTDSLAEAVQKERISNRVTVIGAGSPLGVDSSRYSSSASDISEIDEGTQIFLEKYSNYPLIVFVGRINRDKGVDDLLAALELLYERGVKVAALFIGWGEDEELQEALKVAGEGRPIHWAGGVEDPRAYIGRATTLCLPTLREGFGMVVVEAACMGVPAVVTNATGVRDLVSDGETGLVVPVGAPEELANALERIIQNPELAKQLGSRAQSRAIERYDVSVVWPGYEEYFVRALAEK